MIVRISKGKLPHEAAMAEKAFKEAVRDVLQKQRSYKGPIIVAGKRTVSGKSVQKALARKPRKKFRR